MCAIVGMLTLPLAEDAARLVKRRVRRMAGLLRHRGPDGEGYFSDTGPLQQAYLGHRRLSIFDPGAAGAQPMTDRGGRYTIVFNGAIYNFVELADELRAASPDLRLRGHSDTEVLLEAWAAMGPACLERLNGMFAFAVWDRAERTLSLCRDRFGKKPLYYAWLAGARDGVRMVFASEAKALFVHPMLRPQPDRRVLAEFLLSHSIDHYEETTAFSGVLQVPRGSLMRVAPGERPRLTRFFELRPSGAERPLGPALIAEARDLLESAVALRLRSDVPIGGTVSGGLDSSLLTCLIAGPLYRKGRLSPPYRIFLSQFRGTREGGKGDESHWAEKLVASLPAHLVLPLRCSPGIEDIRADLGDVLYHQEEPFADSSICAHYALMRVVKESGVKVVLNGQGADEFFGGYVSYYYTMLGDLLRRGRVAEALRHARARREVFGEPLRRLLLGGLYHAAPGAAREQLHRLRLRHAFPLSALGRALIKEGAARHHAAGEGGRARQHRLNSYMLDCSERWALPHILRQDDRNAMAFGIESRAPYLDHRLAQLAFESAPTARLGEGYTKLLLREVGRGLLPEEIRLRPDKMGFWSPQRDFLLKNERWVREVAATPPEVLAALVDLPAWQVTLHRFYRESHHELAECVWGGFISSLWVLDTLPRMEAAALLERGAADT